MIDRTVKRAVMITCLVVFTAKFASAVYDRFMDDTQDEMVANQEAFESHARGLVNTENEANLQLAVANKCEKILRREPCERPGNRSEVRSCLNHLVGGYCDSQPSIHFCAIVEELEPCADPFEDQQANGCDKLRKLARCEEKPAPEDRDGLWKIRMDDGMWDGR